MKKTIIIPFMLLLGIVSFVPVSYSQDSSGYDPGICRKGDEIWAACNFPGTHCHKPLWCSGGGSGTPPLPIIIV